jgi:multiple sugar transport system substrate-binding protein
MKKAFSLLLALLMALSAVGLAAAQNPYEVTEPITITWWHAHEDQWHPYLQYMVDKFNEQNPLITVEPVYIGAYAEINTQLIAAIASGDVPALCTANTSYPPSYGAAGICEILDPYIAAYNFPIEDFGEGLIKATTYNGQQIVLPYLISTQVMFYNKTAAEAEGIEMPKTFDEMDAFLEKATLFNEDGTTKRYGTVFGGWDYWYYEMLFKNNGVKVINDDGMTTDINGEASVYVTTKMKEWIDKGYAYYAYGTGASTDMRQLFWDGGAFSVFHTSSLFDLYVTNAGDKFEVGMAWLPGGMDGESFYSEIGGATILIPAVATQKQKNAAWQFMMFMASPEINLYWADKTGYFPTRQSVMETPEYAEYLSRKPEMNNVVSMGSWINPRHTHPAYDTIANQWRHTLYRIFNEDAPIQATLDELAIFIEETLADY